MRIGFAVIALSGVALAVSFVPRAADAMEKRTGLEIEARIGPNICVERGEGGCEIAGKDLDAGFGGGGYLGLRPLSFLSVGVDVGVYSLTYKNPDLDLKVHTTQAMIDLRLYLPFNLIEPFVKAGVGYISFVEKGEFANGDGEERFYSWGNFKFGGGLTLYLIDSEKIGNIGLGADMDFAMIRPTKYKACQDDDCESGDVEGDEVGVDYAMQFNLHFRWVIPIF